MWVGRVVPATAGKPNALESLGIKRFHLPWRGSRVGQELRAIGTNWSGGRRLPQLAGPNPRGHESLSPDGGGRVPFQSEQTSPSAGLASQFGRAITPG
jgi:hypothetical protein